MKGFRRINKRFRGCGNLPTINQKRLHEYLDAFSESTGVPVTLYTPDGDVREEFQAEKKFCKFFETYHQPGSECAKNLVFSAKTSYELGEPYIYSCPVGLIHIAVPVIVEERYCACAVAGPLSMGPLNEGHLNQAFTMNPSASGQLVKIALFISSLRVYTPNQIQKFSLLLYSAVVHSHKNWDSYDQLRERYKRQLTVGDHIQKRKQNKLEAPTTALSGPTYTELEARLSKEIEARNREAALTCLDELFEELILVEGGNFDSIKLHIFELYISLSRMATGHGAILRDIFGTNFELIAYPNAIGTLDELTAWTRDVVLHFLDDVFAELPQVSSGTTRAVSYISAHYMEKLTLRDLAANLYLNDTYLSKLFRQELNTSFTDYLNNTRIEHSMELMRSTDKSLLEIAGLVGFDDQSYFTKIFKKTTGMTPRQYKNQLAEEKRENV